jgi:putative transposase
LDPDLVGAIFEVRKGHAEVYGVRKIHEALRAKGFSFNHKKIYRHLKAMGLTQPRRIKGQRWTRPALVIPEESNTYWEMDLTYVWTGTANVYCCPVIDAFDRDIVGDVLSERCRSQETSQALESAVFHRFGGRVPEGHILTLRVDRGPQFVARRFKETARILNVQLEYAGIQCPEDKPYIESFIGSYKTEEVYRNEYTSLEETRAGWELYKAWYRTERLHQSLGYMSPKAFQKQVLIGPPKNDRISRDVRGES